MHVPPQTTPSHPPSPGESTKQPTRSRKSTQSQHRPQAAHVAPTEFPLSVRFRPSAPVTPEPGEGLFQPGGGLPLGLFDLQRPDAEAALNERVGGQNGSSEKDAKVLFFSPGAP